MGENCGSSFLQQPFDSQSPYLNSWSTPLHLLQQTAPSFMNPDIHMVSANLKMPEYLFPQLSDSPGGHAMEPHAWFYCLPSFRRDFMPTNSVLKEKLSSIASDDCGEETTSKAGSVRGEKKFLVVDQSGDQTTLIFSSGIETPVQCLTSRSPKPSVVCNLTVQDPGAKEIPKFHSAPILTDEVGVNKVTDTDSEMHEDTEELNALLYSDDDSDCTEEDEVTSTGHSPSTMIVHDMQDCFESSAEEVASSMGLTKKRRLFDGGDDNVAILLDTADSVKAKRCCSEYDDDAQSSCANVWNSGSSDDTFSPVNKRMRKEKLTEIVDILQSIVPGSKGKDAIMVLDEAIRYLETLKRKATSLGLDTI
ncbi:Transcription factor putative isoform 2 [Tripterygium wilfordii]|uniref:Transcription factor putative isoform 2 n=1 Tax=Tripterygium wilfordii TaxID=458696 RepID=A0A7J7D0B2_TRIWF|nr:transcription factor bHLH145-like [Tripterygium wilfordii]KAF5739771.1 Transcription factor putative isoform 2 [Tripterygium wilfordii]